MSLAQLLDSRLLMVTGKGGTGKTTFASAMGILGAAKGKRVVVCEVDTQRPALPAIFETEVHFDPVEVHPGLSVCNITWNEALHAYLRRSLPMKRLVRMVLENQLIARLLDITPGSREVVILSRVGNLLEEYDLVVVDMPASGHAFSLLDILSTLLTLFRSGPVRQRALELQELIHDLRTRLVFLAIPEEMVINETIETWTRMEGAELIGGSPYIFLNRATLPSLTEEERALIGRLSKVKLDPLRREFVQAGVWEDRLEQATEGAQARLAEAFHMDPVLVPPAGGGGNPRAVVGRVALHLGRMVGVARRELPWT
ncbi:MAG: AAA family ATPase [Deltaproteobacteria bacterium]|nr:AAA family ATPase [Deltaproteobacteria bacterium]